MHPRIRTTTEDWPAGPLGPLPQPVGFDVWRDNARLRAQVAAYRRQALWERRRADALLTTVIPAAIQLSEEQDFDRLLERILIGAKALCNADGGTLYLRTGDCLQFMLMHTTSLNLVLGGTTGMPIPYPTLHLYDAATGRPNERHVATYAVVRGSTVNISDAYQVKGFEFTGTRAFDRLTGYRSTSFLTVPLNRGAERVIGALQLINALDPDTGEVVPFDAALQPIVEALAALAAVALESYLHEQTLRQQIQQLRIEIDEARKTRQVAAITETDYFQRLQERAEALRQRVRAAADPPAEEPPCRG